MTIILTQAVRIAGTTQPIGTQLTLEGGAEGDLVHRGCATYVTDPHSGEGDTTVRATIDPLTGRSSFSYGSGSVPIHVDGQDINFKKTPWNCLCDFNEGWTATSGSTSLNAAGTNILGGGLKSRNITTASGAGGTITYTLPVAKQFTLDSVKVVGLLMKATPDTRQSMKVYFWAADSSAFVFDIHALSTSTGANQPQFYVTDIDQTAGESPSDVIAFHAAAGIATQAAKTVVRIEVYNGQTAVVTQELFGLFTAGKAKTKIMIGFDMWAKNATNLYSIVFPMMAVRGWLGYLAPPGVDYATCSAQELAQTADMYANGWDVINHSMMHQTPAELGGYSQTIADYTESKALLSGLGYKTAELLGAWPKNTTDSNGTQAVKDLGYRYFRGLGSRYQASMPGNVFGISHPFEGGSHDMSQKTAANTILVIRAAVRAGLSLNLFTHSVYKTGDLSAPNATDPGDGSMMNSPFNYDIWQSTWNLIYAELVAQENAGAIEILRPSDWYSRCTGVVIPR